MIKMTPTRIRDIVNTSKFRVRISGLSKDVGDYVRDFYFPSDIAGKSDEFTIVFYDDKESNVITSLLNKQIFTVTVDMTDSSGSTIRTYVFKGCELLRVMLQSLSYDRMPGDHELVSTIQTSVAYTEFTVLGGTEE